MKTLVISKKINSVYVGSLPLVSACADVDNYQRLSLHGVRSLLEAVVARVFSIANANRPAATTSIPPGLDVMEAASYNRHHSQRKTIFQTCAQSARSPCGQRAGPDHHAGDHS